MNEITPDDLDNILKESREEHDMLRKVCDKLIDLAMKSKEAPDIIITDEIREKAFHPVLDMWISNREKLMSLPKQVFLGTARIILMMEILSIVRGNKEETE